MKVINGQVIRGLRTEAGQTYGNIELNKCEVSGCLIGSWDHPQHRITVQNVRMTKCKHRGNMVYGAILEDITIDGLSTSNSLDFKGVALKHVVLKGKIGKINIWGDLIGISDQPELDGLFAKANTEYYKGVDWALDIREVKCVGLDIFGIPVEKIIRDQETQKVVYPEDLPKGGFGEMGFESAVSLYLERAIDRNEPTIIVMPLDNKTLCPRYMRDFERARELGFLRE